MFMYSLNLMSKNYMCKYYYIGRCGDYLHVTEYRGVETLYICIYICSTENCHVVHLFALAKSFKLNYRCYVCIGYC